MSGLMADAPDGVQFVGPREEKLAMGKLGLYGSIAATAQVRYSSVARSPGLRSPEEPSFPAENKTTQPAASSASRYVQNVSSQFG